MLKWLKTLVAGTAKQDAQFDPKVLPQDLQQHWQTQWHDLFDADANVGLANGGERPDPLPRDIDGDYRLIFELSRAQVDTRAACFAMLPHGAEMHKRFEAYLAGKSVAMSGTKARAHLKEVVRLIEEIGPNEVVDFSKVSIVNRDTKEGLEALSMVDDITILLEPTTRQPAPAMEPSYGKAQSFLTEPLYAAAGNYYQLHSWVTGIFRGGAWDYVHWELFEMWCGGWQVFIGDEGVVLAHRRV